MKPEMAPEREAEYDARVEELVNNPPPDLRVLKTLGPLLGGVKDIMKSGLWLADELKALGCPEDQIVQLGHAHGQLCFGANPWATAQKILNRYKAGNPPTPGQALAERIFKERVKIEDETR